VDGVEPEEFEYLKGNYLIKPGCATYGDAFMQYPKLEHEIQGILPGIDMPFSVHSNTQNNINNSVVSRNQRSLVVPEHYCSELFLNQVASLHETAFSFLKDLPTITDHGVLSLEQWVASRKSWGSMKKSRILSCDPKRPIPYYTTECFVKTELVFKSPLKAPRLIHNPRTEIKARYGRWVFHYTKHLKHNFTVNSHFNSYSPHIKLVWTSGMNRCQIGQQMTLALDKIESAGFEAEMICADYSKFEATQHPAILSLLSKVLCNTCSGNTLTMLLEHEAMICGQKKAYSRTKYSDETVVYTFEGTRTSGDLTTTVGNTLLAMCLVEHVYKGNKDLVYLFQAGDDAFMIGPAGFSDHLDLAFISEIGMKLDVIHAATPPECDYNSSCFIRANVNGLEQYILAAKIGRLLAKCGVTVLRTENMQPTQIGALKFQKALSMAQEAILWPGISAFYKQVANQYEHYSSVKMYNQYSDLVYVGDISLSGNTIRDLCMRYSITVDQYEAVNTAFYGFDPNVLCLHDNPGFLEISNIIAKIIAVDVCEYDEDELTSFKPYFSDTYLLNYRTIKLDA